MKKHKIAAILMIIHGGFMEVGGILAMIQVSIFSGKSLLDDDYGSDVWSS